LAGEIICVGDKANGAAAAGPGLITRGGATGAAGKN